MFFPRFNLTETDATGVLLSDLDPAEVVERKVLVKQEKEKEEADKLTAKAQKVKAPKQTAKQARTGKPKTTQKPKTHSP